MTQPVRKILTTFTAWEGQFRQAAADQGFDKIEMVFADSKADILAQIGDADVAQVGLFNQAILRAGGKLRWIHVVSGGVNNMLFPELVESEIPLTCLKPIFGTVGAEHALAMMLTFSRRLNYPTNSTPMTQWDGGYDEAADPVDLEGATVGIIGLGNMGLALTGRAQTLGMRVLGLARSPRQKPPYLDRLFTPDERGQLLAQSDYVVIAVPLTGETHGMVNAGFLEEMKSSAYLIDCSGRPPLFDYAALVHAIEEGRIAGVALQPSGVSEELGTPPPDAVFWKNPNVIVSSCRSTSVGTTQKAVNLFFDNLKRFDAGEELVGLVDKRAGY